MNRKRLATLCLMIALFLNPAGFDAVQMILIRLSGSLLRANFILYCLAALFFGFYFFLSGNNVITTIKKVSFDLYDNKIKKYYKKRNP